LQWRRVVAEGQGSPGVAAVGLEGVRLGAELHELHGGSGNANLFLASFRSPWVGTTASLRLQLSVTIAYIHASSPLCSGSSGDQPRPGPGGQPAGRSPKKHAREQSREERGGLFGERRRVAFTCLFTTATRARLSLGYINLGQSSYRGRPRFFTSFFLSRVVDLCFSVSWEKVFFMVLSCTSVEISFPFI